MKIDEMKRSAETFGNIQDAYNLFSKLSLKQQEEAIANMHLSADDERTFRLAMAHAKLFLNKPYREAVQAAMGEALYEYFNQQKGGKKA